jgi:hypothetical protein
MERVPTKRRYDLVILDKVTQVLKGIVPSALACKFPSALAVLGLDKPFSNTRLSISIFHNVS